jgi:hypothetical protein
MKQAPKYLSKESAKFWNDILKIYELQPHHLKPKKPGERLKKRGPILKTDSARSRPILPFK